MLLKKSIKKTKNLFLKTLQNLKNFSFGSYDNLPRSFFLNPLSCTTLSQKTHHFDHTELENNNAEIISENDKLLVEEDDHKNVIVTTSSKVPSILKIETKSTTSSCRYENDGAYMLAQKMKDLNMMEVEDVDHVLDVEEALNYYSRLSCPAYVDIVDKFFMDMYQDFLVPKPAVNLRSSSSRRLNPLKI